jgi:hypothetical protein
VRAFFGYLLVFAPLQDFPAIIGVQLLDVSRAEISGAIKPLVIADLMRGSASNQVDGHAVGIVHLP